MKIRVANYALRIVQRKEGQAAVVYRRILDAQKRNRLVRVAAISVSGFTAGRTLLMNAVKAVDNSVRRLKSGPFYPIDDLWGPKIACYSLISSGLTDIDKLHRASENLRHSDDAEASWWLGIITRGDKSRGIRALRILVEAVE
jgi:hypothetical protein